MAVDRGLPSVPQGLPRSLTVYLQSLHAYLLRLAGNIRGASDSQAVRRSDLAGYSRTQTPAADSITAAMLRDGSVTEKKLADGAVSASKIADGVIEGKKLVQGAVGSRELAGGAVDAYAIQPAAVTTEKLADSAVSEDKIAEKAVSAGKLADGIMTFVVSGQAEDGNVVEVPGQWIGTPLVAVTGFSFGSLPAGAEIVVKADGLRKSGELWMFDAVARAVVPPQMEEESPLTVHGRMGWMAVGRQ